MNKERIFKDLQRTFETLAVCTSIVLIAICIVKFWVFVFTQSFAIGIVLTILAILMLGCASKACQHFGEYYAKQTRKSED